ncbi:MAG: hypothetical protein J0H49_28725 [Acidobacteria bacterium]|nr:hypothetical protein [Acidobacteriota bacterium]
MTDEVFAEARLDFRNFGHGRSFGQGVDGKGTLELEQRALGLEFAELIHGAIKGAFEVAAVAGEVVQAGRVGLGEVDWVRFGEDGGFEGFDAAEVPGVGEDAVEDLLLEAGLGLGLPAEAGFEGCELGAIFFGDVGVAGGEAVTAGVLSGTGFALGGDGPGGLLSVGLVGGDLSSGSHDDESP